VKTNELPSFIQTVLSFEMLIPFGLLAPAEPEEEEVVRTTKTEKSSDGGKTTTTTTTTTHKTRGKTS
jgi:hypothetical protein